MGVEYRCVTTSVPGFLQQLVCYLGDGYWFYRTGQIPRRRDPADIDGMLLGRYGIGNSRPSRAKRKQLGIASMHYLRHGRFFVLLATPGHHPFFDEEEGARDARRTPVEFEGYAVRVVSGGHAYGLSRSRAKAGRRRWHVQVELAGSVYRRLQRRLVPMAQVSNAGELQRAFGEITYQPYGPVRRQLLQLLAAVNQARRSAGLGPISVKLLRHRRRIVGPFEPARWEDAA